MNPMDCKEADRRMEDVSLGLVPMIELRPFLDHVAVCRPCADKLATWSEGRRGCPCAHDDVQRELMLDELDRTWRSKRFRTAGLYLAAAGLILVLGLLLA